MPKATNHDKKRARKKMRAYEARRNAQIDEAVNRELLRVDRRLAMLVLPRATPKSTTPMTVLGVDFSSGGDRTVLTVMGYGPRVHELATELAAAPPEARDAVKRKQFGELFGISGSVQGRLSSGRRNFDNLPREGLTLPDVDYGPLEARCAALAAEQKPGPEEP